MANFKTDSAFFNAFDTQIFQDYADQEFAENAFDPVIDRVNAETEQDDILRTSIESTRDYMRQSEHTINGFGEVFRIYPGLINTIAPNAFAAHSNAVHLCGINTGLYGACFELCLFVMAQSSVFSEIGDPEKEQSPQMPEDISPAGFMIGELKNSGHIYADGFLQALIPKCTERYHFSVYLTLLMMRYVWFHEQYHCLNGHIASLSGVIPSIRLNEFPDHKSQLKLIDLEEDFCPLPISNYLQALEIDADRSALWGMFQTQLQNKENIIGIARMPKNQRLKMTLFVSLLVTSVFDEFVQKSDHTADIAHPDSYTRLHNLLRTLAAHLVGPSPEVQPIFVSVLGEFRSLKTAIPKLVNVDQLLQDCANSKFQSVLEQKDGELETARKYFSKFGFR